MATLPASQAELPIYDIKVGEESVRWTVESAKFEQRHGRHDVFVLDVLVPEKNPGRWKDQPISFKWGTRTTGVETFHGYVARVDKDQQFQKQPLLHVHAVGPTWKLSYGRPRFWTNATIDRLARDLTDRARVGLSVDPNPYIWPTYAQTDESDWGTLRKVADELGYLLTSYRGVVRLVDPAKAVKESPVVSLVKSTNVLDDKAMLLEFLPSTLSDQNRSVGVQGFGYLNGGEAVTENDDAYQYDPDTYVLDARHAAMRVGAYKRNPTIWIHRAEARIRGCARVFPGVTVDVVTGLVRSSRDSNDGRWLVFGATHQMDRNVYQTSLMLARDAVYPDTGVGSYTPFWGRRSKPAMFLANDRWTSTWQGAA